MVGSKHLGATILAVVFALYVMAGIYRTWVGAVLWLTAALVLIYGPWFPWNRGEM